MRTIANADHIVVGFNTGLIVLGLIGVLPPSMSALLHNTSTIMIGLKSTTKLLGTKK